MWHGYFCIIECMQIGTTFGHREIQHLGLHQDRSLEQLLDFGFDLVRLGVYWKEVQPNPNSFDLSSIVQILDVCEERGQQVILTVGMKAPRWPEFHHPGWLQIAEPSQAASEVLRFLERSVLALQHYSCIVSWQVENEPLDPSGPHGWVVPEYLLEQEVDLVKRLDKRPIHLNAWGNELSRRGAWPILQRLGDSVGIDLYYKVPFTRWWYVGPRDSDKKLAGMIEQCDKPVWITELQAEAWEQRDSFKWQVSPGSINPQLLAKNFERAVALQPEVILLWGFEYWLWQKQQGRPELWRVVEKLVRR